MRFRTPNRYKSPAEFRERWQEIDPDFDLDDEVEASGPLGAPLEKHGWRLSNRFAVQPMEGWDGTEDGAPTELTLRRWQRFGQSGAALIWGGEAFAVRSDGRANPHQLCFTGDADTARSLEVLRRAIEDGRREVRGEAPKDWCLGLQLTHSGRWSRPTRAGAAPRIAFHHPVLDGRVGDPGEGALLSDGELEAIGERYVGLARIARETGFDFVDVKCCHGYLLHELLAARERPGPYGGSLDGRTKLLRDIIAAITRDVPGLGIAVRISITDLVPHCRNESGEGEPEWGREPYDLGFGIDRSDPTHPDWTEPFELIELLRASGVGWVNLTIGSPYWCPHVQRPAAFPPSDGYPPPEDPLFGVAAHIRAARAVRARFPDLAIVGTGWTYLQEWLPQVAQYEVRHGNQDVIGLGRSMLSYPDLPRDILEGRGLTKKWICRTFSDCTTAPRNDLPSGCFPLDPYYKSSPEAAVLKRVKSGAEERR
jgi:NADPH2 dehydrogenase